MTSDKARIWSGFWPRLLAWIIDCMILGAVCFGIGWFAMDYVSAWGSNGRAFGLVLGVLYFGIMSSGLAGGRTFGMRVCGLKVSGIKGRPLGLASAFGRALLLVAPMLLNGWMISVQDEKLVYAFEILAIIAVFGVWLAQIYLFLFNLPTRRLVHDLIFRSVVVRADAQDFVVPPSRVHAIVAALLVAGVAGLALAAPSMIKAWMPKIQATVSPLQKVQDAVNALPEVSDTEAFDNTTTFYSTSGPAQTSRTLIVTARVRAWPSDVKRELARIGAATVKSYRFAPGQQLTVKITYGFDLGFGSYSRGESNQYSTQCTTEDVKCLAN